MRTRACRAWKGGREMPRPLRDQDGRRIPENAASDTALARFVNSIPDDSFTVALRRVADTDPKLEQFMRARADIGYAHLSFAELCRRFGVTLLECEEIWRKHQLHLISLQFLNLGPKVALDIAIDAESKYVNCPRCDGWGEVPIELGTDEDADRSGGGDGDGDDEGGEARQRRSARGAGSRRKKEEVLPTTRACPMCHGEKMV